MNNRPPVSSLQQQASNFSFRLNEAQTALYSSSPVKGTSSFAERVAFPSIKKNGKKEIILIKKHINFDSINGRKELVAFGSTSASNEPILTYSLGN